MREKGGRARERGGRARERETVEREREIHVLPAKECALVVNLSQGGEWCRWSDICEPKVH
jgi:hypothetical protein